VLAQANQVKLAVFVECSKEKFISLKFPGGAARKMKSETLRKIVNTIVLRYKTEIVWCNNREDCRKKILLRLKKEEKLLS